MTYKKLYLIVAAYYLLAFAFIQKIDQHTPVTHAVFEELRVQPQITAISFFELTWYRQLPSMNWD
jgi:hypothetical protein